MIAEQLISNDIIPLRTSDTGEEALSLMHEFNVHHLPIVNNEQLLGLISEDDILNHDVSEALGTYSLSINRPYVRTQDHIYEVMRLMAEYQLSMIPVVDDREHYIGLISLEDLLVFFSRTAAFIDPGSIIVLEMAKRDYVLSEIARIVESESAAILSAFVTSNPDSQLIDVTIKVNVQHIQTILATFDRYNYTVKASFHEEEYMGTLKDRYDSLINFLNI